MTALAAEFPVRNRASRGYGRLTQRYNTYFCEAHAAECPVQCPGNSTFNKRLQLQFIGGPLRAKHFLTLAVAIFLASAPSATLADQATDEATIRANAARYVESYNRR